jgi:hypothetical protein
LLPASAQGRSHFEPCAESPPFRSYWVGESFEGLPVTTRDYDCDPPFPPPDYPLRTNRTTVVYGDCDASGGDCRFPLQVQTWPACDTWWSSYEIEFPDEPVEHPPLRSVRGVPAAVLEDGFGLEVYTADRSVSVFGTDRKRVRRAARALRLEGEAPSSADLPAPIAGALHGRIDCGLGFESLRVKAARVDGGWRAIVRMRLPHAAYVLLDLERRVKGEWLSDRQAIWRAPKGKSRHGKGIPAGRYRATITARDRAGRRTPVTTRYFATAGEG